MPTTDPVSLADALASPNAPVDGEDLSNSIPMPWDRVSSAPGWPEAMEAMLARLEATESRQRTRKKADRQRLLDTMSAMVAALYSVHAQDPQRWLAYSRDANAYGPAARYMHPAATAKLVGEVADFLVQQGWADHKEGFYRRRRLAGGRGYRSRIRATGALAGFLSGPFGISPDSIELSLIAETIILKAPADAYGRSKRLLPYADTAETLKLRAHLAALNAHLRTFRIDLEGDLPDPPVQAAAEDETELLPLPGSVRLYRVFNNGRWDHGGRFYGGWWQQLPKAHRKRLLIDGEETVELDFKTLHPRLCYHLKGQPLPREVDPYLIPGFTGPGLRDLVKVAFNQLLNLTSPGCPRAPAGARQVLPRGKRYRDLIAELERQHDPIADRFRRGEGLHLQRIDSDIAERVTDYLHHRGICCLPVHDSFIVPRSAEFILGQTMALAYRGALSHHSDVRVLPVITGWTSGEIEEQVNASLLRADHGGYA